MYHRRERMVAAGQSRERQRVLLLIGVMAAACLTVAAASILTLYRVALAETEARLLATVRSQAELLAAVARFDREQSAGYPGGPEAATLSQLVEAHESFEGFGESGEFTVARREGDDIHFVIRTGRGGVSIPEHVPLASSRAEPMRRALAGRTGVVIGPDYEGVTVVAGHAPVAELGIGLVAKMDLAEVRAPFVRAGLLCFFVTLLVVTLGATLFLGLTRPILERLEAYGRKLEAEMAERERLEAVRVELEKMSALGRLAAGMAHELNNPLMGIVNFATLCREATAEDDDRHELLVGIEREGMRCGRLVSDVLTSTHGEAGVGLRRGPVRLSDVVDRAVRLLAPRIAAARAEVRIRLAEGLPEIVGDADRLGQVVINLLANALDAVEGRDERHVEVAVEPAGGAVRLSVADSGPGVPAEDLPLLFEPFFTTKPPGKGTGLGLPVSRGIVEMHGGTLAVEPAEPSGARFVATLPVARP